MNDRIISFDIGIKNMALCMFYMNESLNINQKTQFVISEWTVLNLMDESTTTNETCTQTISKKPEKNIKKQRNIIQLDSSMNHVLDPLSITIPLKLCGKSAKFKKSIENNETYFCEKCAKNQSNFLIPKKIYQSTSLKKMKIEDLEKIVVDFSIESRDSKRTKKSYIDILIPYFQNRCLEPVVELKKVGAGDTDLITIGRNMMRLLDQIPNISQVTTVLIENQISTIASRMKSVQGMLAQYFIIRNSSANIEFISSSNKLKGLVLENKEIRENIVVEKSEKTETQQKQHYKKHKTDGVQITREILEKNTWLSDLSNTLSQSKKKDDLADAFLQGIWYLRKNGRIQMDEIFQISLQ